MSDNAGPRKYVEAGNFIYEFAPSHVGTFATCICATCRQKAFKDAAGDREKYNKLLKEYDAEFEFYEL